MEIAGHNLQHELNDVNNLWIWPITADTTSRSPSTIFIPRFDAWLWTSTSGYNRYGTIPYEFTTNSVTSYYSTGYAAGRYLDLKPGSYVMEFNADVNCAIGMAEYVYLPDGTSIQFDKTLPNTEFDAGENKLAIVVHDGSCILIHMYGGHIGEKEKPATFTNIRIHEGVL